MLVQPEDIERRIDMLRRAGYCVVLEGAGHSLYDPGIHEAAQREQYYGLRAQRVIMDCRVIGEP